MMEIVIEAYGCLWTFVSFGNSVDGVMKIASVIMRIKILAVITLIICYRVGTCRKPVLD